ncbi:MAG: OmpA family protein [Campylobacterota bacterium]|nr:OmpA family protein [Campylobacterota bacterium]
MRGVIFALCLVFSSINAEDKYLDADSPELESIAQNALSSAKIVSIEKGKVIGITGVVLGVEAILKDLNAKVSDTEIKIEMSGDILFDFDKASIREKAEPTLRDIARVIGEYHAKSVLIEGHTDEKGSDRYNLKLSKARAQSVKNWLVKNAEIDKKIIWAKGLGERRPIAQNRHKDGRDNPEGREKNRRVEITVKRDY